ncbi:antibiotic biosynthesis monooxygenase [Aestuariirhabdus sp. Z084]|uniref:putative quinol monooxygenase n=1 Tax=Aestuariirhabdus haliotis TaxID=2918751 RepID=UPI00201B363B|nr:putative quinol monooxygenase [Aestuariirhabdus haliotis]MCL6416501.1 antibiotic biosynthesis monooxygenase [Aestuariirhabdus haliotis]MCL6420491.1 antibiotic biosynthesis monooxygenase [Aestuariirhabdus haliotis]
MIAVVVTFTLKTGTQMEFLPLMLANAEQSQTLESGCHQFDVCTDPQVSDEVFLYELYSDHEAFKAHLTSNHFKIFEKQSEPFIKEKAVRVYERLLPSQQCR